MAKKAIAIGEAEEYGRPVVWTAGFILLAISMIVSGILYIAGFMHDGDILWEGGYFAYVVLIAYRVTGVALIIVAAYGLSKKVYAESLFFVINAVFMIVVSLCSEGQELSDEAMMLVDVSLGLLLLIPVAIFVLRKQILLTIAGVLYIFANLGCEVCGSPADCMVYGIPALIAGIVFAYIALYFLVKTETRFDLPYA